ncbi:cell morphogenesis N-terminal-domain-containing protein [Blastocladiella britannica]|nr:cell morphogenesis N-terminal-domain-containing protein [Blastocladiella britannica]
MSVASDGILVSPAAPVISLLSSGSMSSVAPTVTADQGTSGAAAAAAAAAAGPHLLQRFFPLAAGTSAAVVEVTPTLGVEMCLDTTFSRFVAHADSKIEVVLHHQLTDREIDLHRYLRTSVDAEFDRTLTTLGALAKHAPGLAVNTLMAWRDGAGDLPDVVPSHSLAAVNTGGSVSGGIASIRGSIRGGPLKGSPGDPARDLRLITSNILFCRALIEIIKNVPPAALKDELGLKCEELAFNQLRVSVPDLLRTSTNWLANATYFAQVLGELSATRFTSVSDRYLRELERLNAAGWLKDGKAEHIIFGMKFIQLKLYPMDALDDTADFLDSLGHFFLGAADTSIRQTFMETFVELLTPMCEIITAEVNVPTWVTFVESMFPKVQKMAVRPRHQSVAFSLLAALLSISRADFFSKHWMSVMDMAQTKLKDRDRTLRTEVLLVMVQLLWVYLFRHSEPTITAHKRIGMLVKLLFPPGRRSLHPPEVGTPLFTYVIYMIGVRFPSWCVANLIPPLLACESGNPESGWAPDRMTVAIDAVHWLISAWAGGAAGGDAKPSFPSLPLPASVTQFPSPLPELKPKHQQAFLASIAPLFARILEGLLALVGTPLLLDDERNRAIVPFKPPAASSANLYADLLGTVRSTGSGASGSEPSSAHATSLLIDRHHSESFGPGGPIPLTSMTNGSLSAATGALFNGGGGGNSSSEPPPACFVATVTPARMPFIELLKTLVSALPRIAPFYEQERLIDTLSSFTVHPERGRH